MQITGKLLLNSAEGILKDRKQEQSEVKGTKSSQNASKAASTGSITQTSVESRLLDLQHTISNLQEKYSREQARFSYLKQSSEEINEHIKFDGRQLFPEFGPEFSKEKTLFQVTEQMNSLIQSLKKIQVEMENIHALKFESSEKTEVQSSFQVSGTAVKELNPERVARLTQ